MLPSEYLALDMHEKAFIIASINLKREAEKKEQDKIKRSKAKKK